MNKFFVTITFLLLAALMVTACTVNPVLAPTPTSGAGLPAATSPATAAATVATVGATQAASSTAPAATSAAPAVTTAATTAPSVSTPAATTAAVPATGGATATMAATSAAAAQPTGTAMAAASTPAATQSGAANGTPIAGVSGQFVRLSILLQSSLTTGAQNGQVTGVVIAQPNPAGSSGGATLTPDQSVPYVRYVVANMSGTSSSGGEMLLPWQMFAFNPVSVSANGRISQTFTLKGTAASRTNAPRVSLPTDTAVLTTGWDSQLTQYWASQGFSVPVTGSSTQQPVTEVLLRKTINGASIVDPQNQALGQVSDFLIDPNTGQFVYAVFNGGQAFGNRLFVVPVRNLIIQLGSASAAGLGNIQLNVPANILNNAPSLSSLNQILQDPNLLQQLTNFWQSLQK